MKHPLIAFALSTPWALLPEVMTAHAYTLAYRSARKEGLLGGDLASDDRRTPIRAARGGGSGGRGGSARSIAVVAIRGTIVQRADQLDLCEGGTSTEQISSALNQAMADETVSQILLDIHSPGGSVYGVQELADEIRAARANKPIMAIANSLAASAAYWIGCAASEFYVTPGGEVGSIGVWSAHEDISKALEEAGVNITLISAGRFKTEGNAFAPLSDESKAFMQSRVDDYYEAFTNAVAKGRNVPVARVRSGMGQGRVLGARDALAEKMVDGVMTFPDVVRKMQGGARAVRSGSSGSSGSSGRSAQARRNEIELLSI
ncbi:hypothetical protein WM04_06905 [Burkholderia ubonensis]|uniref:signal peptide peptidase SppA n=1 Tax=Burkholderia ubonensis TaxID=101571 RepID=UPI00075CB9B0|nr:signal peptide peptidase SppA [Burkholderia ubonensis]KWI36360.1 hypothetical protein WM04_06905 [Burkholderia ubonensis]OJB15534.1 hypothetical protein BGV53_20125 [Burkholderia ubonensis]